MKNLFTALLLFIMILGSAQIKDGLVIPKNPKIGLSLAGGGAKGFAHVGVLKVLDSLGVKVDYISGTSMGAIVGGLYAAGYTGKDIEKIVMETDFYTLIANEKTRQETTFFNKSVDKYLLTVPVKDGKLNVLPKAISTGQKNIYMLKELFKHVSNEEDFSKLKIPFMCVATNLESGKMELFERGDLVKSIMASSAFPSLMDPVKIGDSIYIDGAMTVNYPSKPLKDKGIDIVIGVDLSQNLSKREDMQSAIAILNQVIDFGIHKETEYQYKFTDINIKPDLAGMTATSYGDKKTILNAGYSEAQKYIPILSKLPKRKDELVSMPMNTIYSNVYKIDSLILENNQIFGKNYVLGKLGLKLPSLQTYGAINKMIDKLYSTNNYNIINYDIIQENNRNILKLTVTEDDTRFFLKFGLHYDEIFKTGLLLNATAKRLLFKNSTISIDGVIGDKPRYYVNYFIDNGYIPGFGIYASGMSFNLRDKNSNIYESWTWLRNEAFIQSVWRDKYAIGGGLSHDYFNSKAYEGDYNLPRNFINPYAFIKTDSQDDKAFPTRGIYLLAEGKLIDLFGPSTQEKTFQTKADLRLNFPVADFMTYQLKAVAGLTFGQNLDKYYKYRIGGLFEQNVNNFQRFTGLEFGQLAADNVFLLSNNLQFKFYKNFFAIANVSFAKLFDDLKINNLLDLTETSGGITAGYKSPFGQIKANYSHGVKSKKGYFNVVLGHWF